MTLPGADPWSMDYFNPPKPHPHTYKSPESLAPKPVVQTPDEDRLYQVQKNAKSAFDGITSLEQMLDSKITRSPEWQRLARDVENTYRVIRSWLGANTSQGGGFA